MTSWGCKPWYVAQENNFVPVDDIVDTLIKETATILAGPRIVGKIERPMDGGADRLRQHVAAALRAASTC